MPKRIPKAFGRGYRKVSNNPGVTFGLLIGLFVAIAVVGYRGEDTRHVTDLIVKESPCTAAPGSVECQRTKRESDRERSLRDTCIPFKRALTRDAYRTATKCPHWRGVVAQNSPNASQQPGPRPGAPSVDDVPVGTPDTDKPSAPEPPSSPANPSPPPAPVPPSPPPAPNPPPRKPIQVTAPGVNVEVGDGGVCVGVGGINAALGNC